MHKRKSDQTKKEAYHATKPIQQQQQQQQNPKEKNLSKRKDNVAVKSRKRSRGHRPHEVHIKILQRSVTASHGFMLCQGNKIKIHHIK